MLKMPPKCQLRLVLNLATLEGCKAELAKYPEVQIFVQESPAYNPNTICKTNPTYPNHIWKFVKKIPTAEMLWSTCQLENRIAIIWYWLHHKHQFNSVYTNAKFHENQPVMFQISRHHRHFTIASRPTKPTVRRVDRTGALQQPTCAPNTKRCDEILSTAAKHRPSSNVGCSDCTQLMSDTATQWLMTYGL